MIVVSYQILHVDLHHKTRIIVFIGSPITAEEKELIKMAKELNKEKISLDILFGEEDDITELLKKLIKAAKGKDVTAGSNLVIITSGSHHTVCTSIASKCPK